MWKCWDTLEWKPKFSAFQKQRADLPKGFLLNDAVCISRGLVSICSKHRLVAFFTKLLGLADPASGSAEAWAELAESLQ